MIRIKIRTAMIGAMALLAWGAISVTARAADQLKLESIDVQTLSGQQVQLKLHMSGPAPEPLPFTIDKPARIAFDLPNTTLALASRRIDVRSGGVETVLAAEANGRTRLVVNVDSLVPYTTKVDGDNIIITLGSQPGDAAKQTAMARAGSGQGSTAVERAIRTIDFRRGADGTGRVIVQLTDPRTPVNVRQEANQVVVDFAGTLMPKNLMRRYDVMDFATPVQTVDALRVEGSSRLVISAQGDFEQLAYQSDNQYTIEIKPSLKRAAADEKKEYTGERLTLNFQDIDVRSVLQLLADTSGQNIVVSDSVTGNLTLRLQNVPWDQALDIVLRTKGLDKRRHDNVIIIGPTEELASREKAELAAHKEVQELSPTHTEFMQVNYAKVIDLAKLIKTTSAKDSMLSQRGSLSIDERTNTLLVQDTADKLADIRRLVQTLDVPVKQVLIEARIVIVSDTFERDLGARFGVTSAQKNGSNGLFSVTGNGTGADTMTQSGIANLASSGRVTPVITPPLANRYQVNLPAAHTNGSIGVSLLGGSYIVDLELTAAQNEGKSETISSPRIITANQKQATIMQGVEIPYQESASSGATTTQFKNAVLSPKCWSTTVRPWCSAAFSIRPKRDPPTRFRSWPISRCWAICSRARPISTTRPNC
jgi:type IV pilus assembly protein PilQ